MQRQLTHKVRIGAKFRFFGGDVYVLRKLTPADFLDEDDGLPINFFSGVQAEKTMYEQTLEKAGVTHSKEPDTKRQLELVKFMLSKCVISENGNRFDVKTFMERPGTNKNLQKMLVLFSEATKLSFKRFSSECRINDTNAIAIFVLAKRFCRPPIEILLPEGDYSEMDAWMFNLYIAGIGIKEENAQAKKAMSKK